MFQNSQGSATDKSMITNWLFQIFSFKISDVISFKYICPLGSKQCRGSCNQESPQRCFIESITEAQHVSY